MLAQAPHPVVAGGNIQHYGKGILHTLLPGLCTHSCAGFKSRTPVRAVVIQPQ